MPIKLAPPPPQDLRNGPPTAIHFVVAKQSIKISPQAHNQELHAWVWRSSSNQSFIIASLQPFTRNPDGERNQPLCANGQSRRRWATVSTAAPHARQPLSTITSFRARLALVGCKSLTTRHPQSRTLGGIFTLQSFFHNWQYGLPSCADDDVDRLGGSKATRAISCADLTMKVSFELKCQISRLGDYAN